MALKFSLESNIYGVSAPQAYAKVSHFHGNKDQLHIQVAIFFNADAREQGLNTLKEDTHIIATQDLNSRGDLLPAIYEVLKTLPEYQGAVDA